MDAMKKIIKDLLKEKNWKIEHAIIGNKNDIKNIEKEMIDIKQSLQFQEDVMESKIKQVPDRVDSIMGENAISKDSLKKQEDRNTEG